MIKKENNITLSKQIKWAIGNRIIWCLILLSVIVLMSSAYDLYNSFRQIEKSLDNDAKILGEYIVAQSLIENQKGISVKLDELNNIDSDKKFEWIPKNIISGSSLLQWKSFFSWKYIYPVRNEDGESYGELKISGSYFYDNSILIQLITKFSLLIFFSFMIFILLYPLNKRIPSELFITPIMNLLAIFKNHTINNNVILTQELHEIRLKIIELIDEKTKHARDIALGQLAVQVAHDIRSPLAALDVVIKDILVIPEDQRVLIRSATNRIYDIANNLLSYRKSELELTQDKIENTAELIADLVLTVISEKRVQFRNVGVDISFDIDESINSAFAKVSAIEFKRVFSNLLNNAIEAIQNNDSRLVSVFMTSEFNNLIILIKDKGCGIEPRILQKISKGEIVSQKEGGNGLGVFHAKKVVEKFWNGQLVIHSCQSNGTEVRISLPKTSMPIWFASHLKLSLNSKIIILDDDEAIHQVWISRFKNIFHQIDLVRFYKPDDFFKWIENNFFENLFFLLDYELIGSSVTGLDIIDRFKIFSKSFLVTSHYEEIFIRNKCEDLGIKIIPKNYAAFIPISVSSSQYLPELIFIDDDKFLTQAWLLRAQFLGKYILTFNNIDDFFNSNVVNECKNIPIYIDSNLGIGILGQEIAKELYDRGFAHIYLATGYEAINFSKMSWIKAIVGKEPPF